LIATIAPRTFLAHHPLQAETRVRSKRRSSEIAIDDLGPRRGRGVSGALFAGSRFRPTRWGSPRANRGNHAVWSPRRHLRARGADRRARAAVVKWRQGFAKSWPRSRETRLLFARKLGSLRAEDRELLRGGEPRGDRVFSGGGSGRGGQRGGRRRGALRALRRRRAVPATCRKARMGRTAPRPDASQFRHRSKERRSRRWWARAAEPIAIGDRRHRSSGLRRALRREIADRAGFTSSRGAIALARSATGAPAAENAAHHVTLDEAETHMGKKAVALLGGLPLRRSAIERAHLHRRARWRAKWRPGATRRGGGASLRGRGALERSVAGGADFRRSGGSGAGRTRVATSIALSSVRRAHTGRSPEASGDRLMRLTGHHGAWETHFFPWRAQADAPSPGRVEPLYDLRGIESPRSSTYTTREQPGRPRAILCGDSVPRPSASRESPSRRHDRALGHPMSLARAGQCGAGFGFSPRAGGCAAAAEAVIAYRDRRRAMPVWIAHGSCSAAWDARRASKPSRRSTTSSRPSADR